VRGITYLPHIEHEGRLASAPSVASCIGALCGALPRRDVGFRVRALRGITCARASCVKHRGRLAGWIPAHTRTHPLYIHACICTYMVHKSQQTRQQIAHNPPSQSPPVEALPPLVLSLLLTPLEPLPCDVPSEQPPDPLPPPTRHFTQRHRHTRPVLAPLPPSRQGQTIHQSVRPCARECVRGLS
jgi:hypothetical protein